MKIKETNFVQNFLFCRIFIRIRRSITGRTPALTDLWLLYASWHDCGRQEGRKNRKPHQNAVLYDVNGNTQGQIASVCSLITIFVTEYDIDRDLWLISHFRCRQLTETVSFLGVFPFYTHIFLKEKNDSQGWPGRQPGRKPFSRVIWPGAPWPRAATANYCVYSGSLNVFTWSCLPTILINELRQQCSKTKHLITQCSKYINFIFYFINTLQ